MLQVIHGDICMEQNRRENTCMSQKDIHLVTSWHQFLSRFHCWRSVLGSKEKKEKLWPKLTHLCFDVATWVRTHVGEYSIISIKTCMHAWLEFPWRNGCKEKEGKFNCNNFRVETREISNSVIEVSNIVNRAMEFPRLAATALSWPDLRWEGRGGELPPLPRASSSPPRAVAGPHLASPPPPSPGICEYFFFRMDMYTNLYNRLVSLKSSFAEGEFEYICFGELFRHLCNVYVNLPSVHANCTAQQQIFSNTSSSYGQDAAHIRGC